MMLHPRLTRAAVALVKRFETFQPQAEPTPSGGWSIGYGHTRSAREGASVSEADAEALLVYDLDVAARAVERALFAPVSQHQFEALTALCFNLGEPTFLRSSALARVNAGAELDAADEIERWRRAELGSGAQVVDALVRRRAAEKAHFLGLPDGEATWPSAQLRPLAAPGGESEPLDLTAQATASAALTAANGVQARLRRLIPEDAAITPPIDVPVANLPDPIETAAAVEVAEETPAGPEPLAVVEPIRQSPIAWEPTPPPFEAPIEVVPLVSEHEHEPELEPAVASAPATPEDKVTNKPTVAAPLTPRRPRDPRVTYALAGLLGLALFVVAAAMILTGRMGPLGLGLGALGVLLAAPALYGLLGAGQGTGEVVADESVAGEPAADAAPFRKDVPDTK